MRLHRVRYVMLHLICIWCIHRIRVSSNKHTLQTHIYVVVSPNIVAGTGYIVRQSDSETLGKLTKRPSLFSVAQLPGYQWHLRSG